MRRLLYSASVLTLVVPALPAFAQEASSATQQTGLEVERPSVVRAANLPAAEGAAALRERGPPVHAAVVEGVDVAVLAAHHEHTLIITAALA